MGESLGWLYQLFKVVAVVFGVLGGAFIGSVMAPWVAQGRKGQSGVTVVCALVGGLVMWLAVSRTGGWGGPGGGPGVGSGDGIGLPSTSAGKDKDKDKDKDRDGATAVKVHLLGGDRVVNQRFYRLEGDDRALSLTELKQALAERRRKDAGLREIDIILYKDSVDRDNPAVTQLEAWAREQGYTPKLSSPDRKAP